MTSILTDLLTGSVCEHVCTMARMLTPYPSFVYDVIHRTFCQRFISKNR